MNQNNSLALILAAGKGTRMKSNTPKPLNLIYNKPIVSWIIDSFKKNNISVALIINPSDENYFSEYRNDAEFIYQENPLGTGHAVMQAKYIISQFKNIFIFVGDCPFVNKDIISKMYDSHHRNRSDCTILSSIFIKKKFPYARIIRNNQQIKKIVEEKDANKSELNINELFCSHYLFDSQILLEFLNYLKRDNDNSEIYLTNIINELIKKDKNVNSIIIKNWKRLVGLNTKEDIYWLESQKII